MQITMKVLANNGPMRWNYEASMESSMYSCSASNRIVYPVEVHKSLKR